ncbi:tRNA glutamyl-Q(34) synthetase GluQRS [Chromatium okenii]|uniref:tRNA glutamyl-Q(34) synthetase GluQRS n=1 Tax=Chromatium okenii TaxID=61644 RepID=UPI0019055E91|nr:tRNA glutamyl-Q(34) synthetase GluQRS [Chromatium okenii]MBK1640470.1 tRNA glutamyl-Q(34) synthetase GluQRS [Chromatium okenii]
MLGSISPSIRAAYRGRFAPSPTGALHLGSLLTAIASYADARAHGGTWLVRIEDLDHTRTVPGAAAALLDTLHRFGMRWDEPVRYQHDRTSAYQTALAQLTAAGLTYPCGCSRTDLARNGRAGVDGTIYPGTCRYGLAANRPLRTVRLRTTAASLAFTDRIHGHHTQNIAEDVGDFVLRRADGIHAYQLAVVVDDAWQQITQVVRGADLLLSTPRQLLLQQHLGLAQPRYAHIPLLVDHNGHKLSKAQAAAPVDPQHPLPTLHHIWALLGQEPLPPVPSVTEFWARATSRWHCARVPAHLTLQIPTAISLCSFN